MNGGAGWVVMVLEILDGGNRTGLVDLRLGEARLSLDQLNQVVDLFGVDTEAQTARGLRRAIERHIKGGG